MGISRRIVLKTTRLGGYHRTTVSEKVRKLLGLSEGDEVLWVLEEGRIVIERGESYAKKEKGE